MPNYHRETSRTLDAGRQPAIEVRNPNGSVRVRGEDRGDVYIVAKATFSAVSEDEAAGLLRAIEEAIELQGNNSVRVQSPEAGRPGFLPGFVSGALGWGHGLQLDYEIVAPHGSSAVIQLVHGHAEARQIGGDVRVHLVNGSFRLEDIGADAAVRMLNGNGNAVRIAGDVDVTMTNGRLELEAPGSDTEFQIVNGDVDIKHAGGDIRGHGISGRIELEGAIRGDVTLHTGHGRIVLKVPAHSRFELDAQSILGSVTSELDVRDVEGGGRPGPETPRVTLRIQTGNIELRRLREAEPASV